MLRERQPWVKRKPTEFFVVYIVVRLEFFVVRLGINIGPANELI